MDVLILEDSLLKSQRRRQHDSSILYTICRKHFCDVDICSTSIFEEYLTKVKSKEYDAIILLSDALELRWKKGEVWLRQMLGDIKAVSSARVVIIDHYLSKDYKSYFEMGADIMIVNEFEEAFEKLIISLKNKTGYYKINNVIYKDRRNKIVQNPIKRIQNLDKLPFFLVNVYKEKNARIDYKYFPYVSSKGCFYNCSFCVTNLFKNRQNENAETKHKITTRSPINLVCHLHYLIKNADIKKICFLDDNLLFNREWVEEFLILYHEQINLPFSCFARVEFINTAVVRKLKEHGCECICIGLESGDERIRNTILNKKMSDSDIIEAAKIIKSSKIKLLTFNILGNPYETLDMALKTLEFNRKIGADYALSGFLYPIEGSSLYYKYKNLLMDKDNYLITKDAPLFKNENNLYLQNLFFLFYLFLKVKIPIGLVKFLVKLPLTRVYCYFGQLYYLSSKYLGVTFAQSKKLYG